MKNVAHIPAQIERVGEGARLWEAVMKSLWQIAELLTTVIRSLSLSPNKICAFQSGQMLRLSRIISILGI